MGETIWVRQDGAAISLRANMCVRAIHYKDWGRNVLILHLRAVA